MSSTLLTAFLVVPGTIFDEKLKKSLKWQLFEVLTINHVFEILAHFSAHGDWEKAFFSVMPARKGMSKKTCAEGDTGLSGEGGSQSASEDGAEEADEGDETDCPSTKRLHEDGDASSTENQ